MTPFELPEADRALQAEIAAWAQETLDPGAGDRDRDAAFSAALWDACGVRGLCGLAIPVEHGGGGLGPLSVAAALNGLGQGCSDTGLVFAVGAHLLAGVVPIWRFGQPAVQSLLPDLCAGRRIVACALTELEAGSDVGAVTATLTPDGAGYRLSGDKALITNAAIAHHFVVYARTPTDAEAGALTAVVIDADQPGCEPGPRTSLAGHRTAAVGTLALRDVSVPAERVLAGPGAGMTVFGEAMTWERTGLFAAHAGSMQRLLGSTVAFARARHQFGRPIGKQQGVSHRIADMRVRVEAAQLLVYRAAARIGVSRDAALYASMAKLFVAEALVTTARDALQLRGGAGYVAGSEAERALRDAVGTTIYSGTSEIQRQIIARWLDVRRPG